MEKAEDLRDFFDDVLHGEKNKFNPLEICNNNYTSMLLERQEVVIEENSGCTLI